jgi:hypothetical protein
MEANFRSDEVAAIVEDGSPFYIHHVNDAWERKFDRQLADVVHKPLLYCIARSLSFEQTIHLHNLFEDIGPYKEEPVQVQCDGVVTTKSDKNSGLKPRNFLLTIQRIEDDVAEFEEEKREFLRVTFATTRRSLVNPVWNHNSALV